MSHFQFVTQINQPLTIAHGKIATVFKLILFYIFVFDYNYDYNFVLHRLKNSEAVYQACRKRGLLGTYQLQSDC